MNSGIYKIINNINGHFYIGSAVNLHRRYIKHINTLKRQKHKNPILQNAYNKYGPKNLLFCIIELVDDVNRLIEVEQFYIDNLHPDYNICKTATSQLGIKRSEETKEKIRQANIGKNLSKDHKNKISLTLKGRKFTKLHKQKISNKLKNKNTKSFIFKNPSGIIIKLENLFQFCKDNNLDHSSMYKVLNDIYPHHKGWTKA